MEALYHSDASVVLMAGQGSRSVTTTAGLSLSTGCSCESDFTDGTCEDLTGRCYCKPNYTGEHCDACAEGYLNFPHCYRKWGVRGHRVARSGTPQTQRVQEGPTAPAGAAPQVPFPRATWYSCPRESSCRWEQACVWLWWKLDQS